MLRVVLELIRLVRDILEFIERNKNEEWFKASAQTFKQIREAKTDSERRVAVGNLARLWSGL